MDFFTPQPRKKKTDYAALHSPFMRIPGFKVKAARALLDLGFSQTVELQGRCPEALYEDWSSTRDPDVEVHAALRLAVYYADTPDPEVEKLTRSDPSAPAPMIGHPQECGRARGPIPCAPSYQYSCAQTPQSLEQQQHS